MSCELFRLAASSSEGTCLIAFCSSPQVKESLVIRITSNHVEIIAVQDCVHRFPVLAYATTTTSQIILHLAEAVKSNVEHVSCHICAVAGSLHQQGFLGMFSTVVIALGKRAKTHMLPDVWVLFCQL